MGQEKIADSWFETREDALLTMREENNKNQQERTP